MTATCTCRSLVNIHVYYVTTCSTENTRRNVLYIDRVFFIVLGRLCKYNNVDMFITSNGGNQFYKHS